MREVPAFTGEFFSVMGTVKKGKQLGRKIQYPTLNIDLPKGKILPKEGVYLTTCTFLSGKAPKNKAYLGLTFLGTPYHASGKPLLETFLLNFDKTVYNCRLKIHFLDYIRGNERISQIDQLESLIRRDTQKAERIRRKYFSRLKVIY